MKGLRMLIPVLVLVIGLGALPVSKVKADNTAKGGTVDYAALATKYEKMAADEGAVIAEHQAMLKQADVQNPGNEKRGGNPMNKHCNAIIKDAKKLKADYEAFAAFCKMMVKETEKKTSDK